MSRDVGKTLGVGTIATCWHWRRARPARNGSPTTVGTLLPEGTALRVEKPGGSEFMRVASGVNPPIVLKEVFGEFAARPDADDPAPSSRSNRRGYPATSTRARSPSWEG